MFGRVKSRIQQYREKITAGLVANGHTAEEAASVVGAIGDGTIISLLLSHLGDIEAVIKLIVSLFGPGPSPTPAPADPTPESAPAAA